MVEIEATKEIVEFDPLSVYDFTEDDSKLNSPSPKLAVVQVENAAGGEGTTTTTKRGGSPSPAGGEDTATKRGSPSPVHEASRGDQEGTTESLNKLISTSRITRSQTVHSRVVQEEGTVIKALTCPRARGRPLKRKHLYNSAGTYKRKRAARLHDEVTVALLPSRKRKVDDAQQLEQDPTSWIFKTWDFYIPRNKHFHTHVSSHTNCEVVKLLKKNLNDRQLQIFGGTQFGYFLELPDVIVQNQLIHSLLLREVVPERADELWFDVNGTKLRFGLVELGIITGLKCNGDADKGYESSDTNRLMDMYFPGLEKVPKQSLIDCFLQKRWRSDEDAVKIAVLYFIHTFLFSTATKNKFITKADFDIVESGEYETFPWGISVFKAMVETMNNKLRAGLKMYRLGGLPLALQCWFYECCTYVDGKWAHRVDNKVPRILNWKVRKQPTMNELSGGIFKMSAEKLKLKNVSPTEFEQLHWDLPESSGNPNDKELASADLPEVHPSDDDFSTPPPKKSNNQSKTKWGPPVNNLEMSVEIKRLSDGQSELKSDIRKLNEDVFKAIESHKEQMMASFADVFKAIESLSKKQFQKDDSEIQSQKKDDSEMLRIENIDEREEDHRDRHGDGDSVSYNANDDQGSDGPFHGKDSISDEENSEKGNVGAMSGLTNAEANSIFPVKHLVRCKNTGLPAEWQNANKARSTLYADVRLL